MGMFDKFSKEDIREERELRNNPPTFSPGQDPNVDGDGGGWVDPFAPSSPSNEELPKEGGWVDPFAPTNNQGGNEGSFGALNGNGFPSSSAGGGGFGPTPPQEPKKDIDEVIFHVLGKALVGTFKGLKFFFSTLISGWRELTPYGWQRIGRTMCFYYGGGFLIAWGILSFLGLFSSSITNTVFLFACGVLSGAIGLCVMIAMNDKVAEFREENGDFPAITYKALDEMKKAPKPESQPSQDNFFESKPTPEESFFNFDLKKDDEDDSAVTLGGDEPEDDDSDFLNFDNFGDDEDNTINTDASSIDYNAVLDSVDDITPGTQTRAFLFEKFSQVLVNSNSEFSEEEEIEEGEPLYDEYDLLIQNESARLGMKNIPHLKALRKTAFMTQLVLETGTGFKAKGIAAAVENKESFDDRGRAIGEGVFTNYLERNGECFINVVKVDSPKISVKDLWGDKTVKDFMLDTSNLMPVALGVDEFGKPIFVDLEKINSIVVAGKPRLGKTWVAVSIIAQMAMFNSPRDLNFLMLDYKGKGGSEWSKFKIPHVKKVVLGQLEDIVKTLRHVVTVEAPRRMKLFKEYDVTSLKELHRKNPEVELPYLYVVIDEVVNVVEGLKALDKDLYDDYHSLLVPILSAFPYLGIRLMLIPHKMKSPWVMPIIQSNLDGKIIVGGDVDLIKDTLGVTKTGFDYNIDGRMGKMAVSLAWVHFSKPTYVQSAILTKESEDIKSLNSFVNRLWLKLEPDAEKQGISLENMSDDTPLSGDELDKFLQEVQNDSDIKLLNEKFDF